MKSEWTYRPLGELVSFASGGTPSKKRDDYWGGTIPWISAKTLKTENIDTSDLFITEEGLKAGSKIAPKGSILLLTRGSGLFNGIPIARVEKDVAFNQDIKCLDSYGEVENEFIFYWLLSQKDYLMAKVGVTGIGAGKFDLDFLQKLMIPIPSERERKSIVGFASSISEKIRCNAKINDNLEQQAAALFSSLYNRSNTEVRYTDLIQILGGGTPKTGETAYWNGNIAFFTPKDVGTPYTFITEKTITEEGLSHCNSRLYPVNTVFVTARGTVGKVGLSGVPMAMNQSCYALVGKETHQLLVYFYTLKAVDRLKHKASGAVFDAITTRDFDSEQIMKLSDDDAKAFLCVAEPMFQEILNNSIENLRLSTLRDFLLPKLMSGEIDVSSVQL